MRCLVLASALILSLAGAAGAQPFGGGHGQPGQFAGRGGFARQGGMARMAGRFRQRFDTANISHDGHLTLQQARDAGMGAVARRFDQIDTAHKGYVTMDDIRNYRRTMMQQRRAAQGTDDAPDGGAEPPQ